MSFLQAPMYYRKANAAVLVYDITSQSSFLDMQSWVRGETSELNTYQYLCCLQEVARCILIGVFHIF